MLPALTNVPFATPDDTCSMPPATAVVELVVPKSESTPPMLNVLIAVPPESTVIESPKLSVMPDEVWPEKTT